MGEPTFADLAKQLSAGLDLCARARKLDAQERTNAMVEAAGGEIDMERMAARLNASHPDLPYATRSATIAVWVQEQYDRDLAKWEADTRTMLSKLPYYEGGANG